MTGKGIPRCSTLFECSLGTRIETSCAEIEDERVFFTRSSVENDFRSRLMENRLNLCTLVYQQDWWTVHNFPYDESLQGPSWTCGTKALAATLGSLK